MSLTSTINYNNSANFVANTSLDFSSGTLVSLADRGILGTELFGAGIDVDQTANRSVGSATGTANNGATITTYSGNKYLDPSGAVAARYWSYDGANASMGNTGAIRFKVVPQYTGGPAANRYLFFTRAAGFVNQMWCIHQNTLNVQWRIYDSAGTLRTTYNVGNWSPVSGTEYEFEFNIDTQANLRLFIDGVQLGTTSTIGVPYTRTAPTTFQLGSEGTGTTDFYYRDIEIFDSVQHTANFAGEIPRLFDFFGTSETTVEPNSTSPSSLLESFAAVSTSTNSSVGFLSNINGNNYYHNGSIWTASDGTLAQSNTAAEIEADKATLISQAATPLTSAPVKFNAVLASDTGNESPTVTSHTFTYDFEGIQTPCATCEIYGWLLDGCNGVAGTITFQTKNDKIYDDGTSGNFISINESITSRASDGYFEITLPRTADANQVVNVVMTFTDSLGIERIRKLNIIVPNLDTQQLDLAETA